VCGAVVDFRCCDVFGDCGDEICNDLGGVLEVGSQGGSGAAGEHSAMPVEHRGSIPICSGLL